MSGIAGIARADGIPIDRELLLQMARSLSFRGPDAQQIWTGSGIGLAHATHRIGGDNTRIGQPESLGTGTWITADVRLDAREDLVAELCAEEHDASASCSDSQLLLHAYDAWKEECLNHVIGDFSFALWDARQRQLFCACDHFGIRQFYFSKTASSFVFSNTLDCVRLHPQVTNRLNDAAIGDFLLFGLNYDENTTSFADIQHLPRAHWLRWSANGMEIKEYWRPSTNGRIQYKKPAEYVEHFSELLRKAVSDRVRADRVGILLSGGMDSSSVTAVCKELSGETGRPGALHAFTVTSDGPGDTDGPAAKKVARALQIPMHCWSVNSVSLFEDWAPNEVRWPEPVDTPLASGMLRQFREIATHTGVLLSGEGCDNLMVCKPAEQLRALWRQGKRTQAAVEAAKHGITRFSAPDGFRGPLRRVLNPGRRNAIKPLFPGWVNLDFVERLDLKTRWSNPFPRIRWDEHPLHPKGYASLFYPQWRRLFETQDAAYTRAAVEVRYPFLDVRLVNFLLAVPALPWFFRKFLLREAMRGHLPEATRRRPKTPAQDPLVNALQRPHKFAPSERNVARSLHDYVKTESIRSLSTKAHPFAAELALRPWCLNYWLESLEGGKSVQAKRMRAVAG